MSAFQIFPVKNFIPELRFVQFSHSIYNSRFTLNYLCRIKYYMLDSIEAAIEAIKNGKLVIVVDDEERENEGDFITSAKNASPEIINFMSKHGRGLICTPLSEKRCDELG